MSSTDHPGEPETKGLSGSGRDGSGRNRPTRTGTGDGRGSDGGGSHVEWPDSPRFSYRPRTVICDRHDLIRAGLAAMISPFMEIVGEAKDGVSLLQLVRTLAPDVVILDIVFDDIGGVTLCSALRKESSNSSVLVWTDSYYATKYFYQLTRAGVNGFCLKGSGPQVLFDAIQELIAARNYSEPKIVHLIRQTPTVSTHDFGLTEQEGAVLVRLDLRNKEISEELGLALSSVEGCIKNILAKLKVPTRTAAVLKAVQYGFVLLPVMQSRDPENGLTDEQKKAEEFARDAIRRQRELD
ncbi:MAG: response regulator transcription factor [Candidatus Obscuribacterales bacterium]|nr:response regulator transcription factor [Cyanobacteria bacterium SZAS LIN-5]